MTYKYWELEIDGPDKTGKDLIHNYLCVLSGYRLSINVRGIISQMVYAKKFKRNFEYDISQIPKNKVFIVLKGDEKDLEIRCKITHEPAYDIKADEKLFDEVCNIIGKNHYILRYDTSSMTPYNIAKDILRNLKYMEETI